MTEKTFFKAHQNAPEFMVCLGLKVSYFRNVFLMSSILPKNEQKIQPNYYGTSSRIVFVRFLEELKIPKRHFEIN